VLNKSGSTFATASVIAVALASIVSTNPAGATAVDTQVTDAVTQANVKVVGSSPAMSMGTVYQSTANSTGLKLNNSPALVTHAQAITTQGVQQIYSVDTAAAATPTSRMKPLRQDSEAKVLRKIDAMAQRLAECGDDCVLNLHFHMTPRQPRDARDDSCDVGDFEITGADVSAVEPTTPAQLLATCIVARMETKSGVDVEGVAWSIPDRPRYRTNPVTRVDMYVQRLP